MTKREKARDDVPEVEKLPDGRIKVRGALLEQLHANKQSREALAEVHKLTVSAAYEAAEKCAVRLTADMDDWWRKVIAQAGLDPEVQYEVDSTVGIVSVGPKADESGIAVPAEAPAVVHELVRALRERGIQAVAREMNVGETDAEDQPDPAAKPN